MQIREILDRLAVTETLATFLVEDYDAKQFIERLKGAINLATQSPSEGERQVAANVIRNLRQVADARKDTFTPEQFRQVDLLIRPYEVKTDNVPQSNDLPVPDNIGNSIGYQVPNTELRAYARRVHPANIKRGDQQEMYYNFEMHLQANSAEELEKAFAALNMPSAMGKFKGHEADRFIPNWPLSKAKTETMMLYYDGLQTKLKHYGFEPSQAEVKMLEKAPPGKKAKTWIKHREDEFKERYGKRWKQVLYAKAWKLFGD